MKAAELRAKAEKDLHKMLDKERATVHDLSFKASLKQLTDVKAIKKAKRNIAKLLTILRERNTK
jgi:large subunit ribosomal protein L29